MMKISQNFYFTLLYLPARALMNMQRVREQIATRSVLTTFCTSYLFCTSSNWERTSESKKVFHNSWKLTQRRWNDSGRKFKEKWKRKATTRKTSPSLSWDYEIDWGKRRVRGRARKLRHDFKYHHRTICVNWSVCFLNFSSYTAIAHNKQHAFVSPHPRL